MLLVPTSVCCYSAILSQSEINSLLCRAPNSQPAVVDTSTYDVVGGQSHEYDGKDEVYYSAVKAPPTSTGEGKGFTLSECPAYGTPTSRGGRKGLQPAEYEVVQITSNV